MAGTDCGKCIYSKTDKFYCKLQHEQKAAYAKKEKRIIDKETDFRILPAGGNKYSDKLYNYQIPGFHWSKCLYRKSDC